MAVKSAKRALQSPTHPNAPKKGRVDSQSADTSGPASQPAEIITIDDDDAPSPPSLSSSIATTPSTATTGTSSLVIETDRIEYLDSDGPAPPPAFPAKIIVNGQRVGELTAQKIVLKSTEFISENGNKIPIARPGKRVLRVGGVNVGYDGFTLTLPRTPCSVVDISYTSQGCRATIDGVVTYQKVLSVNEAEQKFHDVVSRFNAEDAALSLKKDKEKKAAAEDEDGDEDYRNEWHKLYIQWCRWSDDMLEKPKKMKKFPAMPKQVKRCQLPSCTRLLPNGQPRPLRHIEHCRHDYEMWIRDAADGYNDDYLQILRDEADKWLPSQFEADFKFRAMVGEIWKYAGGLMDRYEQTRRGFCE